MSEMIDRVASAIGAELLKLGVAVQPLNPIAVAVIKAMREPTDAMLEAAAGWHDDDNVWRAMIDEALK